MLVTLGRELWKTIPVGVRGKKGGVEEKLNCEWPFIDILN